VHPVDPDPVTAPPRLPPSGGDSLLPLLERHRRPIAIAAMVSGLAGCVLANLLPPWYEASARLVVVPAEDPTSSGTNPTEAANATLPMVVSILHSRRAADETVAALGLAAAWRLDPVRAQLKLSDKLSVATDRKANLVTVSFEDESPESTRAVVAEMAERARRIGGELWAARNRDHRRALEQQLAQANQQLAAAEDALRDFRERTHVVDLPAQVKATVEQSALLERLRIEKALDLRYVRDFGDGRSVEVQRTRHQRDAASRELEALEHESDRVGPLLALAELPRLEVEHGRLRRAIDEQAARQQALALKLGQLEAAEARPGGRAEIIDLPATPTRRAGPSRTTWGAGGAFAGGLLTALVIAWRARHRKVA
jgi:uncharacterized protein involved in exopolysaccharide biosynthesis